MYGKLFSGTYYFLIKIENRGVFEISNYYAYSTLLALIFFHALFICGLSVASHQLYLISNIWINLSILMGTLFFGWLFIIKNKKYIKIITDNKKLKNKTIIFSIVVNFLMLFFFFISIIFAILNSNQ